MQKLNTSKIPENFRGRNAFVVQTWWIIQSVFFKLFRSRSVYIRVRRSSL